MELDEQIKQQIENLVGRSVVPTDKVNGLPNLPEEFANDINQLSSQWGGRILAIAYLRYLTGCTLSEAIEYLS
jgi:hypothetical protein